MDLSVVVIAPIGYATVTQFLPGLISGLNPDDHNASSINYSLGNCGNFISYITRFSQVLEIERTAISIFDIASQIGAELL